MIRVVAWLAVWCAVSVPAALLIGRMLTLGDDK